METFIEKLAIGIKISDEEISNELFEICEREHAQCNEDCPVYKLNGNKIPFKENENDGCSCFKHGSKMLEFIRKKALKPKITILLDNLKEEFVELPKPVGDFIIANATGTMGNDGMYYHYAEVCKLLKLYKNQKL